jgi:23S rRNA (adenine2503-C2)-methyltransferase
MNQPQHTELLGLSLQQLTDVVENCGQPRYRVRQLLDGLYRQRWPALEQFTTLPRALRRQLSDSGYEVGMPRMERKFVSADETVRYLLGFSDSQSVETVWMPEGDGGEAGDGSAIGDAELQEAALSNQQSALSHAGPPSLHAVQLDSATPRESASVAGESKSLPRACRGDFYKSGKVADEHKSKIHRPLEARNLKLETSRSAPSSSPQARRWNCATICVSTQAGCAVDCAFCMTALLGLKRNLSAGEIVGQVLAVLNDQQVEADSHRVNLVFMGQGEPFLNYDSFMQAVRLLVKAAGIPESRMTVSTSGIVPRLADFGAEPVRPKLAVSLNAANQALRTEIMPITKKWTIEKLMAALREFPLRNRERLTFEYVLLGGVNDGPQQAREVVELIRGLRAKVNLIALNPGPELPFSTPSEQRVLGFQAVLIKAGIPSFVRRPRGRDIYAACGQLKHTTELVQLDG